MFNDCVLLALLDTKDREILLQRIVEDHDAQIDINKTFSAASLALTSNRSSVLFDGKYHPQPDDMEYLVIENYSLCEEIRVALINPQGLDVYIPEKDSLPPIRALLVGKHEKVDGEDHFTVAFQKFKNDQYITAAKHHLFFSDNTFVRDKRLGIIVGKTVDCVYNDGSLLFTSYYFARQILDLSEYYRIASNKDVQTFVDSDVIHMDNADEFVSVANTWERQKIASIIDSGILTQYKAKDIQTKGRQNGVNISVSKEHIIIPIDKVERRKVLGFLDEEVYKGAFSGNVYQTNSKRVAK